MSHGAAEIVREWFDRLRAGDPAPELCHPDIEIRNWDESPLPGPFQGYDGLQAWWRGVTDRDMGFEIQMFEIEDVIPVDDERVVTLQRATGRGRRSGFEVDRTWGSIITVADGKIRSAVGFSSPRAALKAAGLAA